MFKPKRVVILLNMGGARSKSELRQFLKNMFLDFRIIPSFWRFFLSPLITFFRLNKAWKHYELIGGSKIYEHTQSLVKKVNEKLRGRFDIFYAMRYTHPNIEQILHGKEYDEVLLFPLYPHFSTTTTLSSFDDADMFFKNKNTKILKIEHFFDNDDFNKTIIKSIKKQYDKNAELIFSAHSLPLSIAKNDKYEDHIKKHIEILTKMLCAEGLKFHRIHLAYQSRMGYIKWLEPSLDDILRECCGKHAIVYPISFTLDNSETDYELSLYYKEVAKNLGVARYSVCKAQNDDENFAEFISKTVERNFEARF